MKQHKKVTFDFTNYNYGTYDLAVPTHMSMKALLPLVVENDRLIDYQITDGDILKLL